MKKLFTALLAILITASILGGCAAAGGEAEHSAQARQTEATADPTEFTNEDTTPTEEVTESTEESTDLTDNTELTENSTDPTEENTEPEAPKTVIPTIEQVDELTLTARLQSENEKVLTVTLCQKKVPGSVYFYVCTEGEAERTEYLYHVNGEKLTQYLRVNNGAIRNSDVHSEQIAQVYQEQQELFHTFVNYRATLNPDTTHEAKLYPQLSLASISIGDDDTLDVGENDVVYYALADNSGFAGIHRDTDALVILVDAEMKPMMSVTELSLNRSEQMNDLLEKTDASPLLTPEIPLSENLNAFQVECLIYEKDSTSDARPLTLTMLRTEDNLIVYGIETEQAGEPVTLIYEITANGSIAKYQRTGEAGTFRQDTANPGIKDEMKQQLELADIFTNYTSLLAGCQYEYANPDIISVDTGDIVYQVMSKNIPKGYIAINGSTGILKGLYDEQCQPLLVVENLETENVVLDAYK